MKIEKSLAFDPRRVEQKIEKFIKRKISDAGLKGIVVGLSGGIDSAVVTALAVKSLGRNKVNVFFLPESGVTPPQDRKDVKLITRKLGVSFKEIDIAPIIHTFKRSVKNVKRIPLANLKARTRMCLLYYHANLLRCMVAGTGNRSELRCGYFTKYGDGGCDILPIGGLYKTQVKILAKHLKIPEKIINRVPTAGLWRGQTDESELGLSYENLDRVLVGLDLGISAKKIAEALGLNYTVVKKVIARERLSEHKLRLPEVPKL